MDIHHDHGNGNGMSGFCIRSRGGGGGGGGGGSGGSKCGRWNPTAEQVKVLTELFRGGLRTPSTEQIQKISCQLSFYGKIESKNVFYWFQNHKARERQKRRRLVVSTPPDHINNHHHHHNMNNHPTNYNIISNHSSTRLMDLKDINDHDHVVACHDEPVPDQERSSSSSSVRVRETLQLFPLNSIMGSDQVPPPDDDQNNNKLMMMMRMRRRRYYNDHVSATTTFGPHVDHVHHPPLDLRLSFM